jgi:hypothetical protein
MATLQDLYGNAWQDYYKQPQGGSGWNPNAAGSGQVYRDPATGALIRANYNDQGDITQYFAYDPKNEKPGGQYMAYDPSGKQLGAGEFGSDEATKNLMMFLASAGGMSFPPAAPPPSEFPNGPPGRNDIPPAAARNIIRFLVASSLPKQNYVMNVLKKTAPGKKRSMSDTEEKLSKLNVVSAASPTRENCVKASWIRGVRGRVARGGSHESLSKRPRTGTSSQV